MQFVSIFYNKKSSRKNIVSSIFGIRNVLEFSQIKTFLPFSGLFIQKVPINHNYCLALCNDLWNNCNSSSRTCRNSNSEANIINQVINLSVSGNINLQFFSRRILTQGRIDHSEVVKTYYFVTIVCVLSLAYVIFFSL